LGFPVTALERVERVLLILIIIEGGWRLKVPTQTKVGGEG
jgi:hypothetical protein